MVSRTRFEMRLRRIETSLVEFSHDGRDTIGLVLLKGLTKGPRDQVAAMLAEAHAIARVFCQAKTWGQLPREERNVGPKTPFEGFEYLGDRIAQAIEVSACRSKARRRRPDYKRPDR